MLTVAEIIEEAGAPAGSVSVLPMTRELGDRLVADERFKLLSFTGSPWSAGAMKERAGKKKVVLELGGNAGVIVDETADLDWAVRRTPRRRVLLCRPGLHQRPADVRPRGDLGRVHGALHRGRPQPQGGRPARRRDRRRPDGRRERRARTQKWVDEAVALGGQVLLGGKADGTYFPPTVLTDVPVTAQVCSNEAFAPLVVAFPLPRLRRRHPPGQRQRSSGSRPACSRTTLLGAWKAFDELEVGGVIVNDVPTYRIDHMPYGGVKDSGLGREGIRYAIEDMTEIRIMVLATPQ